MTMERRIKTQLSKFKGKEDPDIFIKEFNHICSTNQDENGQLDLFSVCLKKRALEWYA